ncbi:hypothetical protein [Bradyrhizobium sp.]|uniref:hypothetical protein n=1 Tax=Bradyrhizobium sp. TaxID=376 RepID=UPI001C282993|nr:hypothetical protein [Bradyrhizobium sp.]MBU6463797.1 hypothetical protein [Pseudomonadota bacterium]
MSNYSAASASGNATPARHDVAAQDQDARSYRFLRRSCMPESAQSARRYGKVSKVATNKLLVPKTQSAS